MTTKLKRHSLVMIDGQVCQLTDAPKKTIVGTWLIFYRAEVGGRVANAYVTSEELDEIAVVKE